MAGEPDVDDEGRERLRIEFARKLWILTIPMVLTGLALRQKT